MSDWHVVGSIRVKDPQAWAAYTAQVPDTLRPWGAQLVFRGRQAAALAGDNPYPDIVVIRFATREAVDGWHGSPAYQALIPLRLQAADVLLTCYES